ncbi:MAG: methyltransferase domain-containing protein [Acidobacteriota bacterium]
MTTKQYIPALRFSFLTRFYDRVLSATLPEDRLKRRLVAQLAPRPGQRILDLGCGTGTLTLLIKQACPEAEVLGLDADLDALRIARLKSEGAGSRIHFCQSLAQPAPLRPHWLDCIASSLFFHHLTSLGKLRALECARKLLKPGGQLHIADWGRPHNLWMRLAFLGVQLLDGFESTRDSLQGRLIPLMEEAGFQSVCETHRVKTVF